MASQESNDRMSFLSEADRLPGYVMAALSQLLNLAFGVKAGILYVWER